MTFKEGIYGQHDYIGQDRFQKSGSQANDRAY